MPRRRRKAQKQPVAQINITTTAVGAVSLLVFVMVIRAASETGSQLPKPVSGLGLLCAIASVYCAIVASRNLQDVEHSTFFRILGFVLPVLACLLWIVVYVYGIFVF